MYLICVVLSSLSLAQAQQPAVSASRSSVSPVAANSPFAKHLYRNGGKTHLLVLHTRRGVEVYRQVGSRFVSVR